MSNKIFICVSIFIINHNQKIENTNPFLSETNNVHSIPHVQATNWLLTSTFVFKIQISRERTAATTDHEDRMTSPNGGKNIVNLKAMSGSEDGLDRERSISVQVSQTLLLFIMVVFVT